MNEIIDLHALADGELEAKQAKELKARLESDGALQVEYDSILNLKDFLKTQAARYEADDCWQACRRRFDEIDRSRKVESYIGKFAPAVCVVLFVAILAGRFTTKGSAQTSQLNGIFPSVTGQAGPADPKLQQVFRDMLQEAKSAVSDVRVVGIGNGSLGDVPATRFSLVDPQGPLALYVIQASVNFEDTEPVPTEPNLTSGVMGQWKCLAWPWNGKTFVLAGGRTEQQLETIRSQMGFAP
jgi:hypothetical protein